MLLQSPAVEKWSNQTDGMSIWVIGGVCFCVLKAAQHIARDRKLEQFRQSHIWLHIYNVQIHQSKILKHFMRVKLCSSECCDPIGSRGAQWNRCQVLAKSFHSGVFQGGHTWAIFILGDQDSYLALVISSWVISPTSLCHMHSPFDHTGVRGDVQTCGSKGSCKTSSSL